MGAPSVVSVTLNIAESHLSLSIERESMIMTFLHSTNVDV
jgi:hypothetical protein